MNTELFSVEWKARGCVCEIDTDGIIVDEIPNVDKCNEFMSNIILTNTGIEECTLVLEPEYFERAFIHQMKNYILLEKVIDKKTKEESLHVILHGNTFNSSKAAKVYDDAVQNIVDYSIWDKISDIEARKISLDIRMRPIDDFVINVKMSKNISDYNVSNEEQIVDINDAYLFNPITTEITYVDKDELKGSQIVNLAQQMKAITGSLPIKGDVIKYIIAYDKVRGKKYYEYYNPADTEQIKRINYEAYEQLISKLFDATAIATAQQTKQEEDWLTDLLD